MDENEEFEVGGSPIMIRTDLSLDQASVSSPLMVPITIPITCSNDVANDLAVHEQIVTLSSNRSNSSSCSSSTCVTLHELNSVVSSPCPQSRCADELATDTTGMDCIIALPMSNDNAVTVELSPAMSPISNSDNSKILLELKSGINNIQLIGNQAYSDVRNCVRETHPRNTNSDPVCTYSHNKSQKCGQLCNKDSLETFETIRTETEVTKAPKRKRKRRKPDPDEPPLSPPVTVLPPCEVCGNKSSGFHYGANTCEACKGFFRRTLKKNEVRFQCVCTDEEKDERRQGNGVGRNTCPACRYQQCLAVGMSRNAIKIGRYSLQKKTENICQVKTLKVEEDSKSDQTSPGYCNFILNSPSSNSGSSVISNISSPRDQNDSGFSSGYSECGSPGKKSRCTGELTLKEIDTFVKTLYHAHKCLLQEETLIQSEALRRHQKDYFEQYQLKRELFGPMRPISKQEYFELYNSTGIEIDNRKDFLQEAVDYFENKISKLVEFAKCIPGFRELPLQDQANLIKSARIDCGLVALKHHAFNTDINITTTPWGRNMHLDEVGRLISKDFLFAKMGVKAKVMALDLSPEEEAVLTAVLLTFTDRCELSESEKVQTMQYKLVACLEYLIKIRPTNKTNKMWRIFNFLTSLRNVSEWEAEIIKEIALDWPAVAIPEKLESRVIGGLEDSKNSFNIQS